MRTAIRTTGFVTHTLVSVKAMVIGTALAVVLASPVAMAQKPDHAGGPGNSGKGKPDQAQKAQGGGGGGGGGGGAGTQYNRGGGGIDISFQFGSRESQIIRDYYGGRAAKGNCPPGLAKKNNGCLPPGQAKQWQKGRPLGSDLRYYDIPNELRLRLPIPPEGHKYVQLGADLLLIAVATAVVVDAVGLF